MLVTSLLAGGHQRIVSVTSVRHQKDLAHSGASGVDAAVSSILLLPYTTREPINLDSHHPQYVGKQYLQELFTSGKLASLRTQISYPKRLTCFYAAIQQ